ncbi:hypothetical protein [Rhodopseudomonas sp.]|uniref:hypothetical protein n=1 Tax=Rhodopseudomonas sp. TaxID=1078 RepID=UPI0039E56574
MASNKTAQKNGKARRFVIGSGRFRKISAIEGIEYYADRKGSAIVVRSKAHYPEERRKAIIKAYSRA